MYTRVLSPGGVSRTIPGTMIPRAKSHMKVKCQLNALIIRAVLPERLKIISRNFIQTCSIITRRRVMYHFCDLDLKVKVTQGSQMSVKCFAFPYYNSWAAQRQFSKMYAHMYHLMVVCHIPFLGPWPQGQRLVKCIDYPCCSSWTSEDNFMKLYPNVYHHQTACFT